MKIIEGRNNSSIVLRNDNAQGVVHYILINSANKLFIIVPSETSRPSMTIIRNEAEREKTFLINNEGTATARGVSTGSVPGLVWQVWGTVTGHVQGSGGTPCLVGGVPQI